MIGQQIGPDLHSDDPDKGDKTVIGGVNEDARVHKDHIFRKRVLVLTAL